MSINPYESPAVEPEPKPYAPPDFAAGQRTDAPGKILATLAGISFVLQVLNLVVQFGMMGYEASQAE